MKFLKSICLAVIIPVLTVAMVFTIGCNSSGSSDGGDGTLSLSMVDAATDAYQAVYVTIEEVQVHKGDDPEDMEGAEGEGNGWKVVSRPEKTYNLLELVNGVMADLGTTELESGKYTQIRLMLADEPDETTNLLGEEHPYANYIVDGDNNEHDLFIPSGYQTGIKLVHGFEIVAGETVDLVLDFDASKSVVVTGGGEYLLKPTIKIIDTIDSAVISGIVTDASDTRLENALVSAQAYNSEATDEMDAVEVFTSTISDENGSYMMYLPPGSYQVVAYKPDNTTADGTIYGPACKEIEAEYNSAHELNFSLEGKTAGHIAALVTAEYEEDIVDISVREAGSCSENTQQEVAFASVEGSVEITMSVPGGTEGRSYTVVASNGTDTLTEQVEVSAGKDTSVSFDFLNQ